MITAFLPATSDTPTSEMTSQPPQNPRALACLLIERFGERAGAYAMHQSLKALARGDQREAERWRWISEITHETLRFDVDEALGQAR
jgi:hypothetical protein